ncbi:hypothetical protein HK098_007890 [Nowakowskiella sp. JEL0407]|nr:hypothetical protein HK098_007890 [Nowakowskiella sp. JEL0407]
MENATATILCLPSEIIEHIVKFMDLSSTKKFSMTSNLLRDLTLFRLFQSLRVPESATNLNDCFFPPRFTSEKLKIVTHFASPYRRYYVVDGVEYEMFPFRNLQTLELGFFDSFFLPKIMRPKTLELICVNYSSLTCLKLNHLKKSGETIASLGEMFRKLPLLECLCLHFEFIATNNNIGKYLVEFANDLRSLNMLKRIELWNLGSEKFLLPFDAVFSALNSIDSLRELSLFTLVLNRPQLASLNHLIGCGQLQSLYIGCLSLFQNMGDTILVSENLTNLNLQFRSCSQASIISLFRAPAILPKRFVIDIGSCKFTDSRFDFIVERRNIELMSIKCEWDYFLYHVLYGMESCTTLRELECNAKFDETILAITALVNHSESLEILSVDCNYSISIAPLFQAVKASKKLKTFKFNVTKVAYLEELQDLLYSTHSERSVLTEVQLVVRSDISIYSIISQVKSSKTSLRKISFLDGMDRKVVAEFGSDSPVVRLVEESHVPFVEEVFDKWSKKDYFIEKIVVDHISDRELQKLKKRLWKWFKGRNKVSLVSIRRVSGEICIVPKL